MCVMICFHIDSFFTRESKHAILRISYGNSVLVSWCLSQPGTDRSLGEIETSGFLSLIHI